MSELKFSFSVLDRFIHDVQKPIANPTVGDAKRASSAVDDIINNIPYVDELNVQGLRDLIKLAERGKFSDLKNKVGDAISDYQIIESTYKKKLFPAVEKSNTNKNPIPVNAILLKKDHKSSIGTENVTERPFGQELIRKRRNEEPGIAMPNRNSMVTDLSDINRPEKLAENFSTLYDNEWTDAFDSIARTEGKKENIEKEIVVYLADVLRNIYEYTKRRAPALVENISVLLEQTMLDPVNSTKDKLTNPSMIHSTRFHRYAKECVKETAKLSIPALAKDFKNTDLRPALQKYKDNFEINKYIDKCLEITWLMNVQDPPMVMKWPDETQSTDDILESFRHFTKFGVQLDYIVWPALHLYEDGPLVMKGVVQMK